jgi:hypothetical protein
LKSCRCQLWIWRTIYLAEGIWKVHIFRHLFVCFQTSVYTLGEFHQNRNNSTVFEELSVSIVDLTDYFLLAEGIWKVHIFRHLFVCFQTIVYTLGEFHQNRYNSAVFEEMSVQLWIWRSQISVCHRQIHNWHLQLFKYSTVIP